MKIGIITFHWATNYGAVLQAFALQHYLQSRGYKAEIINYVPCRVKFRLLMSAIKNLRVNEVLKECGITKFRKDHLILSGRIYHNSSSLARNCHEYDVYICGSDQIWNEWFVLSSEASPNLSYYLDFVKNNKTRISYATSFGTDRLSQKVIDLVKPELQKYRNISVRENTGKAIIENLGLHATLVADPTMLLGREAYEKLIEDKRFKKRYQLFSYILHQNQATAHEVSEYIFSKFFDNSVDKRYSNEPINMLEWLYNAKNAKLTLTNSFHGVIFSIIFRTHFIVVPVESSGMNDRIDTLLNALNLTERKIETFDQDKIDIMLAQNIDWAQVEERAAFLRKVAFDFIEQSLCN